jgi:hypothetical protein
MELAWPAYSSDLMAGVDGEDFDVYFLVAVAKCDARYVCNIRLQDVERGRRPSVSRKGSVELSHGFDGG